MRGSSLAAFTFPSLPPAPFPIRLAHRTPPVALLPPIPRALPQQSSGSGTCVDLPAPAPCSVRPALGGTGSGACPSPQPGTPDSRLRSGVLGSRLIFVLLNTILAMLGEPKPFEEVKSADANNCMYLSTLQQILIFRLRLGGISTNIFPFFPSLKHFKW